MTTSTLIIGAGPAGLATAGRLRHRGVDFEVLEQTDKIAWSWHNHYDRLCLHTVKELSHLPHLPFPEEYPRYVPKDMLATYYEQYAEHFSITPHFNQEVSSIRRAAEGKWVVGTASGQAFEAKHIVIATGLNRVPHQPSWPGQEQFQGEITHSKTYKNPAPFQGKRVLLIGMGNTGAEIALDLAEQGVSSWIVVRSPLNIVPRDLNGRPTQLTAKQLAKLPFGLGDWLGTQIRKIYYGNLKKYGLMPSSMPPAVQLRETGKTPVIDLGTIDQIKKGMITVVPDIERFTPQGAEFKDGQSLPFDSVIVCTGYRAKIENFLPDAEELLDKYECPKQAIGEGKFENIYFVGFDNYKLGGLLGTIFTDSETVASKIQEREGQTTARLS
ncbi:MAG: NAD(P)/FAD-dependent oxidoreductase [Bacteroidota bacterium]